jgi:hypothetical protein
MSKISMNEVSGDGTFITESLLNFVDLAGSEKVSNHYSFKNSSSVDDLFSNTVR